MKTKISTLIFASMLAFQANAVVDKNFDYHVDRFADIEVLRYEVPEVDRLTLNQKKMIYYLSQAAQAGRDIIWDQNGKY
ncbi:MAG: dihydrofolate reductase, partial [Muribaculaceae bacterium]|nr:dihydrofolate reductase [Muribaculaceae bacterium]